jgi:diguanylate cyclase (GGDEF)-like protein/PAS domain S-box-containing protein
MRYEFCQCEVLLDELKEGVYFVNQDREFTLWSRGAERITGYSAEEMLGRHSFDNILRYEDENGKPLCMDGCPLHKTIEDGQSRDAQVYLYRKDGQRMLVDVKVRPLTLDGEIIGAAEVFTDPQEEGCPDITSTELENLALCDQLTQLPNRRYIDTFLEHQLRDFSVLGIPFGMLMMDIDWFKRINDDYGHDAGDAVLAMISNTFQSGSRKNDFVGRWGGEEFVAILRGVTPIELRMIAEKFNRLIARSSVTYGETCLSVTISVGATMVQPGDTAASILQRADRALYMSKNEGRNRVTML